MRKLPRGWGKDDRLIAGYFAFFCGVFAPVVPLNVNQWRDGDPAAPTAAVLASFAGLATFIVFALLVQKVRSPLPGSWWLVETLVLAVASAWVVIQVGGAGVAVAANISTDAGVKQVEWEYLDAVPTLKLSDFWDRPLPQGQSTSGEVALIVVRIVGLLLLIPAVRALIAGFLRRPSAGAMRGAGETSSSTWTGADR